MDTTPSHFRAIFDGDTTNSLQPTIMSIIKSLNVNIQHDLSLSHQSKEILTENLTETPAMFCCDCIEVLDDHSFQHLLYDYQNHIGRLSALLVILRGLEAEADAALSSVWVEKPGCVVGKGSCCDGKNIREVLRYENYTLCSGGLALLTFALRRRLEYVKDKVCEADAYSKMCEAQIDISLDVMIESQWMRHGMGDTAQSTITAHSSSSPCPCVQLHIRRYLYILVQTLSLLSAIHEPRLEGFIMSLRQWFLKLCQALLTCPISPSSSTSSSASSTSSTPSSTLISHAIFIQTCLFHIRHSYEWSQSLYEQLMFILFQSTSSQASPSTPYTDTLLNYLLLSFLLVVSPIPSPVKPSVASLSNIVNVQQWIEDDIEQSEDWQVISIGESQSTPEDVLSHVSHTLNIETDDDMFILSEDDRLSYLFLYPIHSLIITMTTTTVPLSVTALHTFGLHLLHLLLASLTTYTNSAVINDQRSRSDRDQRLFCRLLKSLASQSIHILKWIGVTVIDSSLSSSFDSLLYATIHRLLLIGWPPSLSTAAPSSTLIRKSIWSFLPSIPFDMTNASSQWALFLLLLNACMDEQCCRLDITPNEFIGMVSPLKHVSVAAVDQWQRAMNDVPTWRLRLVDFLSVDPAAESMFLAFQSYARVLASMYPDGSNGLPAILLLELFHIGCVSDVSRTQRFHACRQCFRDMIEKCPSLLSILFPAILTHLSILHYKGARSLLSVLPLHLWQPTDTDQGLLRDALLSPLNTDACTLAQFILSHLNWSICASSLLVGAPSSTIQFKLHLDARIHRWAALTVTQAVVEHCKPLSMTAWDTIMNSSRNEFYDWAWRLVLSLMLRCDNVLVVVPPLQWPQGIPPYLRSLSGVLPSLDSLLSVVTSSSTPSLSSSTSSTTTLLSKSADPLGMYLCLMVTTLGTNANHYQLIGHSLLTALINKRLYPCVLRLLFDLCTFLQDIDSAIDGMIVGVMRELLQGWCQQNTSKYTWLTSQLWASLSWRSSITNDSLSSSHVSSTIPSSTAHVSMVSRSVFLTQVIRRMIMFTTPSSLISYGGWWMTVILRAKDDSDNSSSNDTWYLLNGITRAMVILSMTLSISNVSTTPTNRSLKNHERDRDVMVGQGEGVGHLESVFQNLYDRRWELHVSFPSEKKSSTLLSRLGSLFSSSTTSTTSSIVQQSSSITVTDPSRLSDDASLVSYLIHQLHLQSSSTSSASSIIHHSSSSHPKSYLWFILTALFQETKAESTYRHSLGQLYQSSVGEPPSLAHLLSLMKDVDCPDPDSGVSTSHANSNDLNIKKLTYYTSSPSVYVFYKWVTLALSINPYDRVDDDDTTGGDSNINNKNKNKNNNMNMNNINNINESLIQDIREECATVSALLLPLIWEVLCYLLLESTRDGFIYGWLFLEERSSITAESDTIDSCSALPCTLRQSLQRRLEYLCAYHVELSHESSTASSTSSSTSFKPDSHLSPTLHSHLANIYHIYKSIFNYSFITSTNTPASLKNTDPCFSNCKIQPMLHYNALQSISCIWALGVPNISWATFWDSYQQSCEFHVTRGPSLPPYHSSPWNGTSSVLKHRFPPPTILYPSHLVSSSSPWLIPEHASSLPPPLSSSTSLTIHSTEGDMLLACETALSLYQNQSTSLSRRWQHLLALDSALVDMVPLLYEVRNCVKTVSKACGKTCKGPAAVFFSYDQMTLVPTIQDDINAHRSLARQCVAEVCVPIDLCRLFARVSITLKSRAINRLSVTDECRQRGKQLFFNWIRDVSLSTPTPQSTMILPIGHLVTSTLMPLLCVRYLSSPSASLQLDMSDLLYALTYNPSHIERLSKFFNPFPVPLLSESFEPCLFPGYFEMIMSSTRHWGCVRLYPLLCQMNVALWLRQGTNAVTQCPSIATDISNQQRILLNLIIDAISTIYVHRREGMVKTDTTTHQASANAQSSASTTTSTATTSATITNTISTDATSNIINDDKDEEYSQRLPFISYLITMLHTMCSYQQDYLVLSTRAIMSLCLQNAVPEAVWRDAIVVSASALTPHQSLSMLHHLADILWTIRSSIHHESSSPSSSSSTSFFLLFEHIPMHFYCLWTYIETLLHNCLQLTPSLSVIQSFLLIFEPWLLSYCAYHDHLRHSCVVSVSTLFNSISTQCNPSIDTISSSSMVINEDYVDDDESIIISLCQRLLCIHSNSSSIINHSSSIIQHPSSQQQQPWNASIIECKFAKYVISRLAYFITTAPSIIATPIIHQLWMVAIWKYTCHILLPFCATWRHVSDAISAGFVKLPWRHVPLTSITVIEMEQLCLEMTQRGGGGWALSVAILTDISCRVPSVLIPRTTEVEHLLLHWATSVTTVVLMFRGDDDDGGEDGGGVGGSGLAACSSFLTSMTHIMNECFSMEQPLSPSTLFSFIHTLQPIYEQRCTYWHRSATLYHDLSLAESILCDSLVFCMSLYQHMTCFTALSTLNSPVSDTYPLFQSWLSLVSTVVPLLPSDVLTPWLKYTIHVVTMYMTTYEHDSNTLSLNLHLPSSISLALHTHNITFLSLLIQHCHQLSDTSLSKIMTLITDIMSMNESSEILILPFLRTICHVLISSKHLACSLEVVLERWIQVRINGLSLASLAIEPPEAFESTFIEACVTHGCLLSLYCCYLDSASCRRRYNAGLTWHDITQWTLSFPVSGCEYKLILLWIVAIEACVIDMSHLMSVLEMFDIAGSDRRATLSMLQVIGIGVHQSTLPREVRVTARLLSVFLTLRCRSLLPVTKPTSLSHGQWNWTCTSVPVSIDHQNVYQHLLPLITQSQQNAQDVTTFSLQQIRHYVATSIAPLFPGVPWLRCLEQTSSIFFEIS